MKINKNWFKHYLAVIFGAAIAVGAFARFWGLASPKERVFDEVYFPVFAQNYLDGVPFYDVHPPLGKFLIAAFMAVFGDVSWAWRLAPLLAGLALLYLVWRIGKAIAPEVNGGTVGLIFASLLAVDGIFIVYSRIGLMDGILTAVIAATFLAAWRASKLRDWWWVAFGLGAVVAIKWVGLALIVPIAFLAWRKKNTLELLSVIWIVPALYGALVYAGLVWNGATDGMDAFWSWHKSAFAYHQTLQATHPWSSEWWSWPLLLRPVLFYYQSVGDKISMITTLGNPLVWWAGTVAVGASLVLLANKARKKENWLDHPLLPLLLGWAAFYLPWIVIGRIVFLYHYMPSYLFALGMLSWWLYRLLVRYPKAFVAVMLVFLAAALYFLPIWMGIPLEKDMIQERLWLTKWL